MRDYSKQRIFSILVILATAVILTCIFTACGENTDNQKTWVILTFDTQGGSKIEPIKTNIGEAIIMPNNPTKEGYIFDGWYLSDTFVEEFNATKTITSDVTLYAKWTEDNGNEDVTMIYTISFMDGEVAYATLNITAGNEIALPIDPTKDGYVFEGWYLDDSFIEALDISKKANSDITVYSKWGCQHTPVKDDAIEPACIIKGLSEGSHCSKCGEILIAQQEIPPKGHNVVVDDKVLPTCLQKGKTEGSHCADCGETIVASKYIPALRHNYVNRKCERCGEDFYSKGLTYRFIEDGDYYELQSIGSCTDSDIVIPSMHNGKPIKSVSMESFSFLETLTSITFPDCIERIGDGAFSNCKNLANITVANANTTYHSEGNCLINTQSKTLVLGCKNSIIPADGSVTSIGESAFSRCANLTNIVIPDGVTSIGGGAFYNCTSLMSVTIPDSVTSIGNNAFGQCTGLTSITIPDSVTSIGNDTFLCCWRLIEVYNKSSLTIIAGNSDNGYVATYAKNVYTDTEGGSKLLTDDNGYVLYIDGTEKILVAYIGTETELTLPVDITQINRYTFYNCSGLTSITIPDSVTSIGEGAFRGCSGLTNISVDNGNTNYRSSGNCLIETGSKTLILGLKTSTIPKDGSVTNIGEYAFYKCNGLTSVAIPDSVTSIGEYAFFGCEKLTSITISNNITRIGTSAFFGCKKLISITIPKNIASIGALAFLYCEELIEVYNKSSLTITAGDSDNGGVASNAKNVYTDAEGESKLLTDDNGYVLYTDGTEKILMGYIGTETELTLPSYITQINEYAFYKCTDLHSITIPDSVTSIGEYAFRDCSSLTSVTIGNSVTSIGGFAFSGCSDLTSITIPDCITSIRYGAFLSCSELANIVFEGTQEQWNAITKGENWNDGVATDCTITCSDGTI